jgi:hypothetical protein
MVGPPAVLLIFFLAGAIPFFTSTTFIGDDHLFLAFARDEPHPWRVLVADLHGGEFYRPLPMLVWWVLGRVALSFDRDLGVGFGVGAGIFGALSCALHSAVAVEVGALLGAIRTGVAGRGRPTSNPGAASPTRPTGAPPEVLAAAIFFLLPLPREAAIWYAASTDLLAAVFGLGAVLSLLRGRRRSATAMFVLACGSKETAVALPFLALVAMRAAGLSWRAALARVRPLGVVLVFYAAARTLVLHGLGGSGDVAAPLGGRLLQIALGATQIFSTGAESPSPAACAIGACAWVGLAAWRLHDGRRTLDRAGEPAPQLGWMLAWFGLALAPLIAAPWVVGARYFYLPAITGAWLLATVLAHRGRLVRIGALALLAGVSLARAGARRDDVRAYEARLVGVRRAVAAGLAGGHRVFQVVAGIKDLDLAVKEAPALRERAADFLVLGDVPASFVETLAPSASSAPHAPELGIDFLLARPPLPPSGAYRFGSHRIVGLARQGDDPTLDEVMRHFPDLRLLRLFPLPEPRSARSGGPPRLVVRDVTDAWLEERQMPTDE